MTRRPADQKTTSEHKCRCPFCEAEVVFKVKEIPIVCQGCQVALHLCPRCHKPIPRDAQKCPNCGAELP